MLTYIFCNIPMETDNIQVAGSLKLMRLYYASNRSCPLFLGVSHMHLQTPTIFSSALLTLTLALSACGAGDGSLGDQPTLSGQLDGWNRGTGFTLQVSAVKPTPPFTLTLLASAPIDAAGNFSITLPGSATLTPLLTAQHVDPSQMPAKCTTNIQISPLDFSGAGAAFTAVSGATTLSVSLGNGGTGAAGSPQVSVSFTYIDRDVSETGSLTCSAGTAGGANQQTMADVHFRTGWNREILSLVFDAGAGTSTANATTGPVPDGVKWTAK